MNSLKHILHVIIDLCFWLILLLVCYIDAINVGVSLYIVQFTLCSIMKNTPTYVRVPCYSDGKCFTKLLQMT